MIHLVADIRGMFSSDPYLAPFHEVYAEIQRLGQPSKERLISLCDSALKHADVRDSEVNRVLIAKILVTLLPESGKTVEYWLRKHSVKHAYEVHFSLFCFLDRVREMNLHQECIGQVIQLIQTYLMNVSSETGQAAWMAGDLLGDHWPIKEGLPILIHLATQAKHPAGRRGAIHGLAHLLAGSKSKAREKDKITNLIREISNQDMDQCIREYAAFVLRSPGIM